MQPSFTARGAGPPVALLHGAVADKTLWAPTIARLADRYRVVAVDYGGNGGSPQARADVSLGDYVQEVRDALRAAGVTGPAILVGHSMGGMIALLHARLYPEEVRGIALVGVTARMDRWMRFTLGRELDLVRAYGPRLWRRFGRFLTHRNEIALHTAQETLRAVEPILHAWDFRAQLRHIHVPVHAASGRLDLISQPRHLRTLLRGLPDATMTVLPGGHSCMDSQPEAFHRWLEASLADIVRRTAGAPDEGRAKPGSP